MRAKGFLPEPLGPETDESIAKARRLYAAWIKANTGPVIFTTYPAGTLGAYFDRFTGRLSGDPTPRWKNMEPRTREDYHRAWKHLEPRFARKGLKAIEVADCERLVEEIEAQFGPHERYRTVKTLRSLYADAIPRLKLHGFEAPTKAIRNPQPRGRTAIWLGAEVAILINTAEAEGFSGMALAIKVAWDTLFSPVDVRTAPLASIKRDGSGSYIQRARTKTDKEAFGHLSTETAAAVDLYVNALGFELTPESPFIRQRNGHAYRTKDTFSADFRDVRNVAFPGDKRQFQDLRRSGNVEADAAGADKATMAAILANTMDTNKFLDDTYTPPTVAKAREVAVQRLAGRAKLAGEIMRRS